MMTANDTILFQGDSITDSGRNRVATERNTGLGGGYPYLAAGRLLAERPADNLCFMNRGVSGNRITDLYARRQPDVLDLQPTLLSVLIGVNDTWHGLTSGNGVAVPEYERIYTNLLDEVVAARPAIKLVLCEPFVLPCGAVTKDWLPEMEQRRAVVRQLAAQFKAVFVPFQSMFDEAVQQAPPAYWAGDGVHPTLAGHQLMTNLWIKSVAGK